MRLSVDTALIFFPRGGSAQVARYLNREYNRRGFTTRIHAGSLGQPGDPGHAPTFYSGLDLRPYDYNPAHHRFTDGRDPQADPLPFHPSYEDRALGARGCPDPMFAAVAPTADVRLTRAWTHHLARHRSQAPDVLHLHHLSHLQNAAYRAYSGVPRITTLHGTELKQIHGMRNRIDLAHHLGTTPHALADTLHPDHPHRERTLKQLAHDGRLDDDQDRLLRTTEWPKWRFADYWHAALAAAVPHAGHIVAVSHHDRDLALRLLPALRDQTVPVITNGVDISAFRPADLSDDQRMANLRRWLVTDPRGWAESRPPGSIRYTDTDLTRLHDSATGRLRPLLLWVGRYLEFKKVPVLLKAVRQVRDQVPVPPVLLMWGGYPGECEGEHPADIARRLGIDRDVYFIGWRGHDELPAGLHTADLMVAPAVNEPFGMVYLEAMGCGTPPIATDTGGPARTITPAGHDATGWLVRPNDAVSLAAAIKQALVDPRERARRAANGARHVQDVYDWAPVADRYAEQYEQAIHARQHQQ